MTLDLSVFRGTLREECAILVGSVHDGMWHVSGMVRVKNRAARDVDYAIAGTDYIRVVETLKNTPYQVVGFLHTHLPQHEPIPTQSDIDGVFYKASINAVFHPATGVVTWYTSQGVIGEEAVLCDFTVERRFAPGRVG